MILIIIRFYVDNLFDNIVTVNRPNRDSVWLWNPCTKVSFIHKCFNITLFLCVETRSGIDELYTLSYLWYTAVGILTTVVVGIIVSFLTGIPSMHVFDVCVSMFVWACIACACEFVFLLRKSQDINPTVLTWNRTCLPLLFLPDNNYYYLTLQ